MQFIKNFWNALRRGKTAFEGGVKMLVARILVVAVALTGPALIIATIIWGWVGLMWGLTAALWVLLLALLFFIHVEA